MKRTRTNKNTIAYWMKFFGFELEWWDIGVNKWNNHSSAEIVCYGPDMSRHKFNF